MPDHKKIDAAVQFSRASDFWFSRRQPRYQDDYVQRWGEWLDDQVFRAEGEARDADLL